MRISSVVVACAMVLAANPLATAYRSARALPETFTAFAINMNRAASTTTVDMRFERWSSDADRDRLLEILRQQKDPDRATRELLRGLQELPRVGSIRTPNSVAWDLRYAREQPLEDGGRQIVLATDRPIGVWEASSQARTLDYPFTVIELRLNKDDVGEGKLLAGTKIYIDRASYWRTTRFSRSCSAT